MAVKVRSVWTGGATVKKQIWFGKRVSFFSLFGLLCVTEMIESHLNSFEWTVYPKIKSPQNSDEQW